MIKHSQDCVLMLFLFKDTQTLFYIHVLLVSLLCTAEKNKAALLSNNFPLPHPFTQEGVHFASLPVSLIKSFRYKKIHLQFSAQSSREMYTTLEISHLFTCTHRAATLETHPFFSLCWLLCFSCPKFHRTGL